MKRHLWLVVGLAVVLNLMAVQCGPATPPATEVAATKAPATEVVATKAPATEVVATKAPAAEKTLVIVSPALAATMDHCPSLTLPTFETHINLYAFWAHPEVIKGPDGMPRDNAVAGEAGMRPGVFKSWEVSEDGTVWTVHIRDDVFDSFGNQLKAGDVKWMFDRMRANPACSYIPDAINITDKDQVKVIDDYTLRFNLRVLSPIFLRVMYSTNNLVFGPTARQHAITDDPWAEEWLKRNAPATGPYMLESWTPGEQMVWVRNPKWYGAPPAIDKVIYRQVPEASNRVALVVAGKADIARDLNQEQLDRVDQAEGAKAVCVAGNYWIYMALNTQKGPTADPAVRRALAYAVPYQDILDRVYRGRARRLWSFVVPDTPNVISRDANPYKYDLEKAKEILGKTNYAKGFDLPVLFNANYPEHERIAVLLKDSFSQIGVNLLLDKKPDAAYIDRAMAREFGAIIHEDYSAVPDVTYVSNLWLFKGPPPNFNFADWSDPEFERLKQETGAMKEGPERATKQVRMQELVIEQSPWLFLANPPTCYAMRKNVTGYTWHINPFLEIADLDITK